MLFLPLEEDSLLFRVCLYYGLVVLVLEIAVPLLFKRRVRVDLPHVALHAPATPLSTREYKQRRQALQLQITALQQEIAATPRRTPQKKRQVLSKKQPTASPCPSPTSSVEEVVQMQSPVGNRESDWRNERSAEQEDDRDNKDFGSEMQQEEDEETASPPSSPLPVGLRRPVTSAETRVPLPYHLPVGVLGEERVHGDRSFRSRRDEEDLEEKQESPQPKGDWEQVAAAATERQKPLPNLPSRSHVQHYSEGVSGVGYNGTSEAEMRLEALIASRRRRRTSSPLSHVPVPPPPPLMDTAHQISSLAPKQQQSPRPLLLQEDIEEDLDMEDKKADTEEKNESPEKPSDFKAFCASFATGGAASADYRIAEKRKHYQAFEKDEERPKEKTPRIVRKITFDDDVDALVDTPSKKPQQSNGKRKHQQAFGIIEDIEDDDDAEWRDSLAFRPH